MSGPVVAIFPAQARFPTHSFSLDLPSVFILPFYHLYHPLSSFFIHNVHIPTKLPSLESLTPCAAMALSSARHSCQKGSTSLLTPQARLLRPDSDDRRQNP